jgi:hypothetical protein
LISQETLNDRLVKYQEKTFHTAPRLRLNSIDEAVEFVNERGFVFFWPYKNLRFPSLWKAVAGDRDVPNNHDDPAHKTWTWKDDSLGKRRWYYARVLRRKNTLISFDSLPYFYALSPNYGDYERDYLDQYEQGLLTAEAKLIYEALLYQGPLDTISLRQASYMASSSSSSRFQRALDDLQIEFKIMPVGVSEAGAWRYSFIYDIVPRHLPEIEQIARPITLLQAREHLLKCFLVSLGASTKHDMGYFFSWREKEVEKTIKSIQENDPEFMSNSLIGEKTWFIINEIYPRLISK